MKLTSAEVQALSQFIRFVRADTYGCNTLDVKRKGRALLLAVKEGKKISAKDFKFYDLKRI